MSPDERQVFRELVIRVDERLKSMEKESAVTREVLVRVEKAIKTAPCQRNSERLKTLERFTWGAVAASIGAIVRSFWTGS